MENYKALTISSEADGKEAPGHKMYGNLSIFWLKLFLY